MLNDKSVLITGGTGSLGNKLTRVILDRFKPDRLIIFSRDEYKQSEMAKVFSPQKTPVRYFLGDIRDKDRLYRAFEGVDYVIHAAALKQVPALEYNPTEAVKTNVDGADNIVDAAIDAGVKRVIAVSTDKAVNPINLYGATKLVAEKIFTAANAYGGGRVKFSVVRYGNVVGSRGSVIPLFLNFRKKGIKEFPITDRNMTRFWITLDDAARLVLTALERGAGGEIFVPRIPSMRIEELARAITPDCEFRTIGIRPGEKVYETLVSEDEARNTKLVDDMYVILPNYCATRDSADMYSKYDLVPGDFTYRSDMNEEWLTEEDLQTMIKGLRNEGDPVRASVA